MWGDKHRQQAKSAKRHRAARLGDALRAYLAIYPDDSLREVARVFGVSHTTVKRAQKMRKFEAGKKANVESVKARSQGKARLIDQIREIKADNPSLSTRQIGEMLDCSQSTVSRALRGT